MVSQLDGIGQCGTAWDRRKKAHHEGWAQRMSFETSLDDCEGSMLEVVIHYIFNMASTTNQP